MSKYDEVIAKLNGLIDKIEKHTGVEARPAAKPQAPKQKVQAKVELPPIIADFSKCDLHVTQVVECQNVDYSDKLLLMKLKTGENQFRTFAAGVAHWYKPADLLNKKIITILNLPPRPMAEKRIVSEAMLFAGAWNEHNNVVLCFPDQSVEVGARVVPEGFEDLPAAEGQPKKHFDRVLEVLLAQKGFMTLDGKKLLAGGKPITVAAPDGSPLG